MKVLYSFAGSRSDKFSGEPSVDFPDTQFYGFYRLVEHNIDAHIYDTPSWMRAIFGFRVRHVLVALVARRYDVVFGSALLYSLAIKRILRIRAHFVLLNISLTRTLTAHSSHPLRRAVVKWLLRGADVIVCLSRAQEDSLVTRMPELSGRVRTVLLGVDTLYHLPVYTGRKEYILSAGRDNGRDYVAVIDVARNMPERTFQIVCSERNLKGIERIPSNVEVFIDLPPAQLYKKYAEAQALLLLTQTGSRVDGADCSGQTVLLEAMASGLPVVVTDHPYLNDYASDGQEVIITKTNSLDDVIEKLHILDKEDARNMLAKAARKRVEQNCSSEKMAKSLIDIFERVSL
ncbi:MAG: glycosyltransferase family 4 protein [bacterium]|nr:glycosyltransferase family 4 protein [bacterium]